MLNRDPLSTAARLRQNHGQRRSRRAGLLRVASLLQDSYFVRLDNVPNTGLIDETLSRRATTLNHFNDMKP